MAKINLNNQQQLSMNQLNQATAGTIYDDINKYTDGTGGQINIVYPPVTTIGTLGGMSTSRIALTQEEHKELTKLEEEHKKETTFLKKEAFKAISSEIRQMIVNAIILNRESQKIKQILAPISPRLSELRSKNIFSSHIGSYSLGGIPWPPAPQMIINETGLSDQEIIDAHNEACAEEALTQIEEK